MATKDNKRALFAFVKKHGFVLHRQTKHYVFKHSSGKILVWQQNLHRLAKPEERGA